MFLFKKVATISGNDLAGLLSQRPTIIDVREKNEFASGHIPGAKNVPLGKINQFQEQVTGKLYVVCHSGMRSKQAATTLIAKGYEAVNLKNGMMGWNGPVKR